MLVFFITGSNNFSFHVSSKLRISYLTHNCSFLIFFPPHESVCGVEKMSLLIPFSYQSVMVLPPVHSSLKNPTVLHLVDMSTMPTTESAAQVTQFTFSCDVDPALSGDFCSSSLQVRSKRGGKISNQWITVCHLLPQPVQLETQKIVNSASTKLRLSLDSECEVRVTFAWHRDPKESRCNNDDIVMGAPRKGRNSKACVVTLSGVQHVIGMTSEQMALLTDG